MNAKLFFTLNLFACTGIGACNGVGINKMDKKPIEQKPEIKAGSSRGSKSGNTSSEKKIREDAIEQLSNMVEKELGGKFPKEYKNFLIEYDTVRLKNIGLWDPVCIFSFQTPEDVKDVPNVVCREVRRYKNKAYSFPRSKIEQVNIPLCIATQSEAHSYKDGDEDEAMIYYYIDLKSSERGERPLKIYRVLRDNKVESTHIDNMSDFLEYCQKISKGIKKSIEDMGKKRTKKST